MRIAGSCLLIVGLLLCASIAWAAAGFFMMGVGLLFFLASDKRKKVVALRNPVSQKFPNRTPLQGLSQTSVAQHKPWPTLEQERWRHLSESDEDLANAEAILARYGAKYVSQLSKTYLIFENKALLSNILNVVVASYRHDAGLGDISRAGATIPRNAQSDAATLPAHDNRSAPSDSPSEPIFVRQEQHREEPVTDNTRQMPMAAPVSDDITADTVALPENHAAQTLKELLDRLNQPSK